MKCHTNDNSTSSTQLPHKFSYIDAILGHNHFESPNTSYLGENLEPLPKKKGRTSKGGARNVLVPRIGRRDTVAKSVINLFALNIH
jgi:hypothetical protein